TSAASTCSTARRSWTSSRTSRACLPRSSAAAGSTKRKRAGRVSASRPGTSPASGSASSAESAAAGDALRAASQDASDHCADGIPRRDLRRFQAHLLADVESNPSGRLVLLPSRVDRLFDHADVVTEKVDDEISEIAEDGECQKEAAENDHARRYDN